MSSTTDHVPKSPVDWDNEFVDDFVNAVVKVGCVDWFCKIPHACEFFYTNDSRALEIQKNLKYRENHSGASIAATFYAAQNKLNS